MLTYYKQPIQIPLAGGVMLKGCLTIPVKATSIVIFAEEGGYSRQSAPSTLIEHFLKKPDLARWWWTFPRRRKPVPKEGALTESVSIWIN